MPAVLDPDAAAVFKAFQEAGRPPYETVGHEEARRLYLAGRIVSNPEPPELASTEPLAIPAPHGPIPARIYTPKNPRRTDGLAPALVFFHGGGWVIGDLESHDVVCRKLADEGRLIVISVDYRLAPEHKFPAAVDDSIAATQWIADNARQLGIDAVKADGRRRQRRRQPRRGGRDSGARRQRARDRGPGADLSRHRFCHDASLAQRAGDQPAADAFRDQMVSRSLPERRRRRARLARLARARHDAGGFAAGLCADRRRRSPARRRRRIREHA